MKQSRILANALRETRARNYISHIKTQGDVLVDSAQKRAQAFRDYYANLYQLEAQYPPASTDSRLDDAGRYFQASGMQRLLDDMGKELEAPITTEESQVSEIR